MNDDNVKKNIALLTAVFILAAFLIICGLTPLNSFWGFNHLRYLPDFSLFIVLFMFIMILIPSLSDKVYQYAERMTKSFRNLPKAPRIIIIAFFTGLILYLFRVHVHSLGDGYQRIYQIEKGYLHYFSEPLDFYLHALLYRGLKFFGIESGEPSYVIISIASGMLFTVWLYLYEVPKKLRSYSTVLKIGVLFSGGSLLFFGYVESYTLNFMFSLLYLLNGLKFLYDRTNLAEVVIFFLLASASHITALVLFPSFLYLIISSWKDRKDLPLLFRFLPLIVGTLPILGYAVQHYYLVYISKTLSSTGSGELLPLYSSSEYCVLSLKHFLDILNQILLVTPLLIIGLVGLIFRSKQTVIGRKLRTFGLISIISFSAMLLLLDPQLGFARDWDLFATVTAMAGLIILVFWIDLNRESVSRYSKTLLAGTAIIFSSIWIVTNADNIRQLKRAENLLSLSNKGSAYGLELLAQYYRFTMNNSQKALELLQKIPDEDKGTRILSKIAKASMDLDRPREVINAVNNILLIDEEFEQANYLGGMAYLRLNRPDSALIYFQRSNSVEPNRYNVNYYLGNTYYQLDSISRALDYFKRTINLSPKFAPVYFDAGNMYRLMGIYDSAYVFVQYGLQLDPKYPNGYELLNTIQEELHKTDK
ncbi:MAG: tetratricopeptide repeat protein [Candidatus Zixiibacteriota bacterium]